MEQDLALDFVRVVEEAAIAAARTMGQGVADTSDQVAVQAMRRAFERMPIAGTIVIGEGERDKAPMLYIGEPVGKTPPEGVRYPSVDIAVDPLEGTNLCSTGASNAIAVLAASEPGGLLHAPDCYMEKIIAGPACRGALDLDATAEENLKSMAGCLEREVSDLTIAVLERPRHMDLIAQIRKAGARIRLLQDGDLSAGIAAAVRGAGIDAVMGIGGAPEGVITAAALRCLHGEMVARLVVNTPELEARVLKMGIKDPHRIYRARELAPGRRLVFAACGVTQGALLNGVRFFGEGCRTHSLVMTRDSNTVRFVDAVHLSKPPGPRGVRLY
ncbi:MAG: class II fructose-bisphosphatase [Acidobacteria bacterium]|nr:class II fructose-bisphosphatase [Acidobacteriota bacterium]